MQVASLVKLSAMPNISSLIGSQGSKRVLDNINASSGAVYFGSNVDPYADNYRNFKQIFTQSMQVKDELMQSEFYIVGMNEIVPIVNESQLIAIPPVMQTPILTYAPIRHYYNAGAIEGWGIELPEEVEDTTGRLISNGLLEPHYDDEGKWVMPDTLTHEWHHDDPEFTEEDLEAMDDTRRFFASFIANELAPGNDRRDPTGSAGFGTIGNLK